MMSRQHSNKGKPLKLSFYDISFHGQLNCVEFAESAEELKLKRGKAQEKLVRAARCESHVAALLHGLVVGESGPERKEQWGHPLPLGLGLSQVVPWSRLLRAAGRGSGQVLREV